ncbi:MAG: hypothetical protein H0T89_32180 [Deltaproteobacteria bacterium]|nr:hypothetical protein [Deltaproteobacteria bacterium]MDQ3296988.1 hypothetical protein [Myxococcota bacterium]
MTGPREPRKRRAKDPDYVIDPMKPNATIELETADLLQLGQSGLVDGRPQVRDGAPAAEAKVLVDLGPDPETPPEPEVQTVFVDMDPVPAPPVPVPPLAPLPLIRPAAPPDAQRVTPTMLPVQTPAASARMPVRVEPRGTWLVVLVYLLSASALGVSIYYRFVA